MAAEAAGDGVGAGNVCAAAVRADSGLEAAVVWGRGGGDIEPIS